MVMEYPIDKDRVIVEQHQKIISLAGESEKLKREKEQLMAIINDLRTNPNASTLLAAYGCDVSSELRYSMSGNKCHKSQTKRTLSNHSQPRSASNYLNPGASRQPSGSASDGCIAENMTSMAGSHQMTPEASKQCLLRQRSFKRVRNVQDNSHPLACKDFQYELSTDIQSKQIEMLERKYGGGTLKTQQAAEIIQYNFRQYTLSKNFERLRNTRDDTRVQRMMSDVSSERDSVWSDVTIAPYGTPPPMPLIDIERVTMLSQPYNENVLLTPPMSSPVCTTPDQLEYGRTSPDGMYSGTRIIPGCSYSQLPKATSRTNSCQTEIPSKLHSVRSIEKDRNDNVACLSPKVISKSPLSYDICDSSRLSSESGDSASIGSNSDAQSYMRNQSVTDSRLVNVKIQFNKCSDKERKRQYRIGLNLFNKKPEKGIKYLMEQRFLENSSKAVAKFLLQRKGLSKQMIGDYLGNLQNSFNQDVLLCVVQELDLAGCEMDQALRKLINHFRLPGEAQKIERIIERFAQRYCLCNPAFVKQFKSVDTIFLIAFAIIMLNTDLHNPNIKPIRKMKLEAFIKNLKGIDRGGDVPSHILVGIYERIQANELKTGADHTTQVRKVQETMVGKVPQLVVPHRRLVCYCRLYELSDPQRKEKLGLHQREVFLFNDILIVTKIFAKKKNSITYSYRESISLSDVLVQTFETEHYLFGIKLISRIDKKPVACFNARNHHDREKFVDDLKESIAEMQEMDTMRISEELKKQNSNDANRFSKDSGVVDVELIKPSQSTSSRLSAPECPQKGAALCESRTRSTSLTELDKEQKKRHSNGSVDSGMISTSTGSMASREESPNFHYKLTNGVPTQALTHSPTQLKVVAHQKKTRLPSNISSRHHGELHTTAVML